MKLVRSVTHPPWPSAGVALCAVALSAASLKAEVIFSNFGPGATFDTGCFHLDYCTYDCWTIMDDNISHEGIDCYPNPVVVSCTYRWHTEQYAVAVAQRFTPALTATFTSARLALHLAKPEVGVRVSLQQEGPDGLPGAVLEEIWVRGMSSGVHTATSVLRPRLKAGTAYWLSVKPAPLSSYPNCVSKGITGCGSSARWCENSTGDRDADNVAFSHFYWSDYSTWSFTKYATAPDRARGAFEIEGDTSIPVTIDIKPQGVPNSVNPRSNGVIPVALLSSPTFDVGTVILDSIRFGRTGAEAPPAHHALEHVNGDGDVDMVLHFRTQQTGIACGNTQASLTGMTLSGQRIRGTDSIQTVGCK